MVEIESELKVLTQAKELSKTIFVLTEKSPKKFRFTLVSRMQNLSLNIVSNIYNANETYIDMKLLEDFSKTIRHIEQNKVYDDNQEKFHMQNKLFELKLARATKIQERVTKRLDYSYAALTNIKELDHLVSLSREMGCLLPKQQEQIARCIFDVRNLIGAFIKSDKKRYNQ